LAREQLLESLTVHDSQIPIVLDLLGR
jgi:hypothetical protein